MPAYGSPGLPSPTIKASARPLGCLRRRSDQRLIPASAATAVASATARVAAAAEISATAGVSGAWILGCLAGVPLLPGLIVPAVVVGFSAAATGVGRRGLDRLRWIALRRGPG